MTTSESGAATHVYVVAEHRLAAEYLLHLLHRDRNIHSVLCERFPLPDPKNGSIVFVIDTECLSLSLGECVRRLASRFPRAKFLVVTPPHEKSELAIALRQGVHGILLHTMASSALVEAVRTVARGELWVTNDALQSYLALTAQPRNPHSESAAAREERLDQPTPREAEIVQLVRQRLSNKEIASILGVQESTVKYHLSNVFGKLRIGSRHQLLEKPQGGRLWNELRQSRHFKSPVLRSLDDPETVDDLSHPGSGAEQ